MQSGSGNRFPTLILKLFKLVVSLITIVLDVPYRIERFIEGQAFLRSYHLPVRPAPSPVCQLDCRHTEKLRKIYNLPTGEGGGEGVGEEPTHTIARMPGPLSIIQYSLKNVVQIFCYNSAISFFTGLLLGSNLKLSESRTGFGIRIRIKWFRRVSNPHWFQCGSGFHFQPQCRSVSG
jgi:hypothetical protein